MKTNKLESQIRIVYKEDRAENCNVITVNCQTSSIRFEMTWNLSPVKSCLPSPDNNEQREKTWWVDLQRLLCLSTPQWEPWCGWRHYILQVHRGWPWLHGSDCKYHSSLHYSSHLPKTNSTREQRAYFKPRATSTSPLFPLFPFNCPSFPSSSSSPRFSPEHAPVI